MMTALSCTPATGCPSQVGRMVMVPSGPQPRPQPEVAPREQGQGWLLCPDATVAEFRPQINY